ncbi:MAG: DNA polymerase IV [Kordiimonadaceae bacterium]|jgi:DNA polymerase IV|nr:DNA polymerase IV [Kordiimonadaceae bacterium]MBT6037560.1 DNA polymerase IV [Kordiimonadaceae bacterium]MBT6330576.1 DNA polymerase IV [Kordiimonadaceae bacterium]MBT7582787.1 DNA polymerase IV [Kordiimonadaceae bacterium]
MGVADEHIDPAFCRDCLSDILISTQNGKCPNCNSPRIMSHPEIHKLSIAHIDCDAFYASVEKRDNPDLNSKPLIIGGGRRGVVSTCCYIARTYGVKSAMPMFKANKLCPSAVVLPPDMNKYSAVSKEIRKYFDQLTPSVEPISIDEAFLDLSGTEKLHGMPPSKLLSQTAKKISDQVGITVSVGLSYNKFLAKLASDLDKPNGFSVIGKAEAKSFLANLPISKIWGVGKVLNNKMNRAGITQIGQLQKMELKKLSRDYGIMGERLYYFSRGDDSRTVQRDQKAKSVSNEITLNEDLSDYRALKKHLWALCEKLSARLKEKHLSAKTITLKLKTSNFRTISRSVTLDGFTQMAEILYNQGKFLLKAECKGLEYRLIGIGVTKFSDDYFSDLPDLLDPQKENKIKTEKAMDKIREKFGAKIINKGRKFT